MKKIGKYGLYVPPTLAVLTAAPRAFAQSCLTATLSGTVTNLIGTPFVGATVAVACTSPLSTKTATDGSYTIPNIPPGKWVTVWDVDGCGTMEEILYKAGEVVPGNRKLACP